MRGETGWLITAIASLLALGFGAGILAERIHDAKPMPCHEDEAYVWIDAPTVAGCVPLDTLEAIR